MEVVLDLMQRHMWEELFDHVDKEFENGIHSKIFYIIQMTDPFSLFIRMTLEAFKEIDVDGDGQVSKAEFVKIMSKFDYAYKNYK